MTSYSKLIPECARISLFNHDGITRKDGIKNEMLTHFNEYKSIGEVSCDQCDFETTRPNRLRDHILYKHKGISQDCEHCNFRTSSKDKLRRHTLTVHEDARFSCQHCELKLKSNESLKNHIISKHINIKPKYPCAECFKLFTSMTSLQNHIKLKHMRKVKVKVTEGTMKKNKQFSCNICDLTVKKKIQMVMHSQYKHNIRFK